MAASSNRTLLLAAGLAAAVLVGAGVAGTIPRLADQRARARIAARDTIPVVSVVTVARAAAASSITLPGTVEPLHQAAIHARATGYVRRFNVDLGSSVHAGQVLAVIETPDLDQQLRQAQAQLRQDQSMLTYAQVEDERWQSMVRDSVVTIEQYDQKRQAYQGADAAVAADQANADRLTTLVGFEQVVAPFAGVITSRNIDVGAFVTATGASNAALPSAAPATPTSLFEMTQTDTMRVYLSVPEADAPSVHQGDTADVRVTELPNQHFGGRVVRTARAVDPTSRTLLAEVDIANRPTVLMPGMYARLTLGFTRETPPLVVPASAVLFLPRGLTVAEIGPDHVVHRHVIAVGRDFGSYFEVTRGVADGATLLNNPTDDVPDGTRVQWRASGDTLSAQPVSVAGSA